MDENTAVGPYTMTETGDGDAVRITGNDTDHSSHRKTRFSAEDPTPYSRDGDFSDDDNAPYANEGHSGDNHDPYKKAEITEIVTTDIKNDSKVHTQVTKTEDVRKTKKQIKREKCFACCKTFMAFLFSTIGLTLVTVGYTAFGGFIFMKLEAPDELRLKSSVKNSRLLHAKLLWDLNDQYNVFYPDNWTRAAERILLNYTKEVYKATKLLGWDGNDEVTEVQWTFAGSLLYSITVITTIGKLLVMGTP